MASLGFFAWFWFLSDAITAVPATTSFQGSVDVLLKGAPTDLSQVRSMLTVSHGLSNTGSKRVQIEYVACGKATAIDGIFVFAGDSRLSSPVLFNAPGALKPISMVSADSLGGVDSTLGRAQFELYPFHLSLTLCITPENEQSPVPSGSAIVIGGDAQQPVVTSKGIRNWFAPPAVGYLPGASSGMLGAFSFDSLAGEYFRNVDRTNQVRLELPGKYTSELARPNPNAELTTDFATVSQGARALFVGDRLFDGDTQASVQYRVIAASIAVGIGGNIIASLLWDLASPGRIRRRRRDLGSKPKVGPGAALVERGNATPAKAVTAETNQDADSTPPQGGADSPGSLASLHGSDRLAGSTQSVQIPVKGDEPEERSAAEDVERPRDEAPDVPSDRPGKQPSDVPVEGPDGEADH